MGCMLRKERRSDSGIFSIVWLDGTANNCKENIEIQRQLRKELTKHLTIFTDDNQCEQYIRSVSANNRIVLIVNGHLGQIMTPRIHDLKQISSIYVYCLNKAKNEQWSKQHSKVKSVIVCADELIRRIQSDQKNEMPNQITEPLVLNIFNPNATTTGINGQFLHSQLLIECLIRMKSMSNEKQDFLLSCKERYKKDASKLKAICEFEHNYTAARALYWYTRDSMIYKDLNMALRTQNINLLFLFRFFIRDLAQQLKNYQCSSPVRTYRGQFMSNAEIKAIRDTVGKFISINTFFSTSLCRTVSELFLGDPPAQNGLERVLFEIEAVPRVNGTKPFASVASFSMFPDEEEILMMIGSVFRLTNVSYDSSPTKQMWIVQMELCNDNDHDLKSINEHMQNEFLGVSEISLGHFGNILRSMGKLDDAEIYYNSLLKHLPSGHEDIASCYYGLGIIAANKTQYKESLEYYKKALDIYGKTFESSHRDIANIHNCIGSIHKSKGEFSSALKCYNEALIIYQRIPEKKQDDIAKCFGNIGNIYEKNKKYFQALDYHEKALEIWQKSLPADHRYLGSTHNNIANVYYSLGRYNQAFQHYTQSLEIKRKSFPHQHPSIGNSLENIGNICEKMGQLQSALIYFLQAAEIYNHFYPSTHSDVVHIQKKIRLFYRKDAMSFPLLRNRTFST